MSEELYYKKLMAIDMARGRLARLQRVFYRFGQLLHSICVDEDEDFIEKIEIFPSGKGGILDGAGEASDTSEVAQFGISYLGRKIFFRFNSIGAGLDLLLKGEVLVSTQRNGVVDHEMEIAKIIYDFDGNVLSGPTIDRSDTENLSNASYCRSLVVYILFDQLIAESKASTEEQ